MEYATYKIPSVASKTYPYFMDIEDLKTIEHEKTGYLAENREDWVKYLSELIDLYELLKKAYNDEKPKDGLKLIINNVEKIFEKEQIKHIDCVGKTFNHNIHHAISTVEDDCEDEIIVEEVKKGYLIADKVLRPSQVIVSKKKEKL